MFIVTAKLTRKRMALLVVAIGLVLGLVIMGLGLLSSGDAPTPAPTGGVTDNASRLVFLEAYGWQLHSDPVETLRLLLPADGGQIWDSYNKLQTEQGFDLSSCYGKRVERFTYNVTNYPGRSEAVQANLYVCDDTVVAGDIFCAGENGFQSALTFPAVEQK